jgi:hypothetical protein
LFTSQTGANIDNYRGFMESDDPGKSGIKSSMKKTRFEDEGEDDGGFDRYGATFEHEF